MSLNYGFMVALAAELVPPPARLLDFGCGGGEIVAQAAAAGFDARGVDTYQDIWEQYAHAAGGDDRRILRVEPGAALPFADASFDVVVSNMVLEHVERLGPVAAEIARVLRPDGVAILAFPTTEIISEPHLHAPVFHWCATGSPLQRFLLRAGDALGLGNRTHLPRQDWEDYAVDAVRRHIFYRSQRASIAALAPALRLADRREADYLLYRIRHHRRLGVLHPLLRRPLFRPLLAWACVRLATVVFVLQPAGRR